MSTSPSKKRVLSTLKRTGNWALREGATQINRGRGDLKGALAVLKAGTALLRTRLDLLDEIAERRTKRLLRLRSK
jgi:hypothetical protein